MNILTKTKAISAPPAHNTGVALFEILIALLVLSVGLLGLATLQSQGLRSSSSATMRTEATFLAMDIIDSMRASMTLQPAPAPPAPPGTLTPTIDPNYMLPITGTVTNVGASITSQDLAQWTATIQVQLGSGQQNAWAASIAPPPIIPPGSPGALIVTIMWDDARTGARGTNCSGNAAVDMACFQTLFQP